MFVEIPGNMKGKEYTREKILLVLLPFWAPLIPPMGISCLKSYLVQHGCRVKTKDVNMEEQFREFSVNYFDTLKEYVPVDNWRNNCIVGKDVLQNHMMACLNYKDEKEYVELVRILINKSYFCPVNEEVIGQLNEIVHGFYVALRKYFIRLLDKEKPSVIGFSVYESTAAATLFAAKLAKEKNPLIKTVIGGGIFAEQLAPGSPNWELFLDKTKDYIDKIIIGEGEILFLKYLRNELPESKKIYTIDDIEGKTLELSSAGLPDFSDFNLNNYLHIPAYTSRSCPFQCSFCSETIQWGKYRKKNVKQIVEELKALYRKFGIQLFWMCDSLLNPVISGLANELVNSDISVYWEGHLRADEQVGNMKNAALWRQGGFYKARMGIESGSRHVLELMGKKITVQQIKNAISSLAYTGIKTCTFWIVGYPGETRKDFQQTLDLVDELKDDIYEAWCTPFTYYPNGQANTKAWAHDNYLLYPGKARDMLIFQTWVQDSLPPREETYRRMNLFVEHCGKMEILSPVTYLDVCKLDERWRKLHANAVPMVTDFEKGYIDENKKVRKLRRAKNIQPHDENFGF